MKAMERLGESYVLSGAGIAGLDFAGACSLLAGRLEEMHRLRERGCPPVEEGMRRLQEEVCALSWRVLKEYGGITDEDTRARVLLAVMDAYEVTGKEELLEEALERAEKLLSVMADGALKCRLYGYCHYYTGAEECREEAERILEALNQKGKLSAIKKAEADACFREFVSQKE